MDFIQMMPPTESMELQQQMMIKAASDGIRDDGGDDGRSDGHKNNDGGDGSEKDAGGGEKDDGGDCGDEDGIGDKETQQWMVMPQYRAMFEGVIHHTRYDRDGQCLRWQPLRFAKGPPVIRNGSLIYHGDNHDIVLRKRPPMIEEEVMDASDASQLQVDAE